MRISRLARCSRGLAGSTWGLSVQDGRASGKSRTTPFVGQFCPRGSLMQFCMGQSSEGDSIQQSNYLRAAFLVSLYRTLEDGWLKKIQGGYGRKCCVSSVLCSQSGC